MAKTKYIYFNQKTGSILHLSKEGAKKLDDDWRKLEFIKNEQGTPVMRFKFNGATVDVSENGTQEVTPDVNNNTN